MFSAGEGLDPTKTEPPADAGLGTEGEPPAAADDTTSEPPQDGEPSEGDETVAVEGADSDEAIFTALEKDLPEELKPKALEAKKRLQGFLTKKTQEMSRSRITPEIAAAIQDYTQLDQLLKTNPRAGMREIARRLQVQGYIKSPDELLVPDREPEALIDPSKVEDWQSGVKYFNQELQRRDETINKLQATIEEMQGRGQSSEFRAEGVRAVTAAAKQYAGFAMRDKAGNVVINNRGEPIPTEQGMRAIKLVTSGRVAGPTALEDAWLLVTTPALKKRLDELEKSNRTIKDGVRGAQPLPGNKPIKTEDRIIGKGNVFDRARADVQTNGLGV